MAYGRLFLLPALSILVLASCGSSSNSNTQVLPVSSVSAGDAHACATLENGTIKCWGSDSEGQLGDGSTDDSSTPVQVQNLTSAIQISSGSKYACALFEGNAVKCWGDNEFGQLGSEIGGSEGDNSPILTQVQGLN